MKTNKKATKTNPAIAKVADQLIDRLQESLESGESFSWIRQWTHGTPYPCNYDGRRYSGLNLLGLENGQYITFKRIQELQKSNPEIHLIKGSHARPVIFYKAVTKETETEEDEEQSYKIIRYYNVFSIDQVEGLNSTFDYDKVTHHQTELHKIALDKIYKFAENNDITIMQMEGQVQPRFEIFGENQTIFMAHPNQFKSMHAYLNTFLHETAHSSMKLMKRSFPRDLEECFAQMSASIACNLLGIQGDKITDQNDIAYVESWLSRFKKDKAETAKALMKCATEASKFVELLLDGFDLNEYMKQHA